MAKTATKKSAPKSKAKAAAKAAPAVDRTALNDSLREKAVKLRDKGTKIGDIAVQLSTTTNKVQMLLLVADMRPKDRIKGHDPELIVEARDEKLQSWAQIAARAGDDSIGKVKRIYSEATGRDANQGYDTVSARSPKAAPKAKATKPKAKASKAKAAAPKAAKAGKTRPSKGKKGKSGNPSKG